MTPFSPFLIFLVSVAGLALGDPESAVKSMLERTAGFLPRDAVRLLTGYGDDTLQSAGPVAIFLNIAVTLWVGSGAAVAITRAANRAYGVTEDRPFWKLRGISILLALGFTLLIAALTLVVSKAEIYVGEPDGQSGALLGLWSVGRWALAFAVVTLALDILYYLSPDAWLSFK